MFELRLIQLQELGMILPQQKCCFMIEDAGATLTDVVPDRIEEHDEFAEFIRKNRIDINMMRVSFISVDSTTNELEIWLDL